MTKKRRDPHALGAKQRKAGAHKSRRRKIRKAIEIAEAKEELRSAAK